MKNKFNILIILLFCSTINAQIKTRQQNVEILDKTFVPYDSLTNFIGVDAYKFIGQTFYVPIINDKRGYLGFNVKPSTGSTYKKDKNYSVIPYTKPDAVEGKYFDVLDTVSNKYGTQFLKLKERISGDVIFYNYHDIFGTPASYYDAQELPFICVGYYEKQKQLLMEHPFYFLKKGYNTAYKIGESPFDEWRVIDYQIAAEKRRRSLFDDYWAEEVILQDKSGTEQTMTRYDAVNKMKISLTMDSISRKSISTYSKYGSLRIGITEETCRAICGEPEKINLTTYSWGTEEQWVYKDKYIYFENGIVTAIQEEK